MSVFISVVFGKVFRIYVEGSKDLHMNMLHMSSSLRVVQIHSILTGRHFV